MKYSFSDIKLPKWISYRTYFPMKEKSRTYILNEKDHTYIQLDDISSDFFFKLSLGENEFTEFIKEKNLIEATDDFLESLSDQNLITLKNYGAQIEDTAEFADEQSEGDSAHFVEEMNSWLFENGFMSSIFFELTYRCNLKCIHCYNPKHMADIEIPFDDIKSIIDDAYDLGCFNITVSGGEAAVYSHFIELIRYIRGKHMSLTVFTNGQCLAENENLYRELIENYPHSIGISLYSMDEKQHEKVTSVKGSYNKTVATIKRLRNDGIYVQIKNFLLGFSCHDCIAVAKFGKEVSANVVTDISLIPTIEGDCKTLKYALSEDDLFNLFSDENSPLYVGKEPYLFNIEEHKGESLCFGGFSGICVSPDLQIHVCSSLPLSLGDLKNESLKTIWDDAIQHKQESKLYQWQKKTFADLTDCYKHSYCKFCHYCAGMGYLENGYLKKSDVLCSQAKAKEKAYKYLINNAE